MIVPTPSTSTSASSFAANAGTFVNATRLDAAVLTVRANLDDARGRLQAKNRLGLDHLDHAGLEQNGRDADRVRARHQRILGRLHDHEAVVAVGALRGDDQVRVSRNRAARLAQQEATKTVVAAQREHLLEDGVARRRLDPADDDISHLAAGMDVHDRE